MNFIAWAISRSVAGTPTWTFDPDHSTVPHGMTVSRANDLYNPAWADLFVNGGALGCPAVPVGGLGHPARNAALPAPAPATH